MAWATVLWVILIAMRAGAATTESFHICYFSFNNQLEVSVMQKLVTQLNANQERFRFTVAEYLAEGSEVSLAFMQLIDKKVRCDGLVITGHHTGSFGGARGKGSLHIDFLENLSADPKFQMWFQNVRLLWLQGCRTLGVRPAPEQNADSNTRRVGEVIDEDQLDTDYLQLNRDFSTVFDTDNPIGERYRRVFQFATIFGWTQSAPSTKAESEYSLPVHFAHYSWLEGQRVKDPRYNLRSRDYAAMGMSLGKMLQHVDQKKSIQAWLNAGTDKLIGFENHDVAAYPSLPVEKIEQVRKITSIQNELRQYDPKKFIVNLRLGLSDSEKIGYLLSDILYAMEWLERRSEQSAKKLASDLGLELSSANLFLQRLSARVQNTKLGMFTRLLALKALHKLNPSALTANQLMSLKKSITDEFAIKLPPVESASYRRVVAFRAELLFKLGEILELRDLQTQLILNSSDTILFEALKVSPRFLQNIDERIFLQKLKQFKSQDIRSLFEIIYASPALHKWQLSTLQELTKLYLQSESSNYLAFSFFDFLKRANLATQETIIDLVSSDLNRDQLRAYFYGKVMALPINVEQRQRYFNRFWQSSAVNSKERVELLRGLREENRSAFLSIAKLIEMAHHNPQLTYTVIELILQKTEAGQERLAEWIWILPQLDESQVAEFAGFEYNGMISDFNKRILGEHLMAYFAHNKELALIAFELKMVMGPQTQQEFEQLTAGIDKLPLAEVYALLSKVWKSSKSFSGEAEMLLRLVHRAAKESKEGVGGLFVRSQQISHHIEGFENVLRQAWEISAKDNDTAQDIIFCLISYAGQLENKLQFIEGLFAGLTKNAETRKALLELFLKHHGDDQAIERLLSELLNSQLDFYVPTDDEDDEGPELDVYLMTLAERFSAAPWAYSFLNKVVQKYAYAISPGQMRDVISARPELTQIQKQELLLRFVQKSSNQLRYMIWDFVESSSYRETKKIELWMVPAFEFLLNSYFLNFEEKNKLRFLLLDLPQEAGQI